MSNLPSGAECMSVLGAWFRTGVNRWLGHPFCQERWLKSTILTSLNCTDHLSWLGPHLLVPIPPIGPLPWFMSGLLWDLCNLVLEGKRLLPLDVETDLGSTSMVDSSRGVQEWPLWTRRFFNIPFGKPGHNVDTGAKVAECFWEVHHADGDRDEGRPGSPLSSLASVDSNLNFVEDGCSSCCSWSSLRRQASQGSDCLSVQYL